MIKNEHNFQVNTQKIGPVRISPQAELDIIWLIENSLQGLPNNIQNFKKSNFQSINKEMPNIWKNFPNKYQVTLEFIDERTGHELTHEEAVSKNIPKGSPFMSAEASINSNTAETKVKIFTRPQYHRNQLLPVKWSANHTTYAVGAIKHEFAHIEQLLLGDIINESQESWPHIWVVPLFMLEGYAMTKEWVSYITKDRQHIIQPFLFHAMKIQEIGDSNFSLSEEKLEQYLASWVMQAIPIDSTYKAEIWKVYITGLLLYLSIIGLKSSTSADELMDEITETPPIILHEDEFNSLPIYKKNELFSTLPQWVDHQMSMLEFEMQKFYYSHGEPLTQASISVYERSIGKQDVEIDKDLTFNKKMLNNLTDGITNKDLLIYANRLSNLFIEYGRKSPFIDTKKSFNRLDIRPISVYSRGEENPHAGIIKQKLFLD